MIKYILLMTTALFFTACVNKHGISAKYYSDCDEYYDYQGYYHKECGKDDIVTYKKIGEVVNDGVADGVEILQTIIAEPTEPEPEPNVW